MEISNFQNNPVNFKTDFQIFDEDKYRIDHSILQKKFSSRMNYSENLINSVYRTKFNTLNSQQKLNLTEIFHEEARTIEPDTLNFDLRHEHFPDFQEILVNSKRRSKRSYSRNTGRINTNIDAALLTYLRKVNKNKYEVIEPNERQFDSDLDNGISSLRKLKSYTKAAIVPSVSTKSTVTSFSDSLVNSSRTATTPVVEYKAPANIEVYTDDIIETDRNNLSGKDSPPLPPPTGVLGFKQGLRGLTKAPSRKIKYLNKPEIRSVHGDQASDEARHVYSHIADNRFPYEQILPEPKTRSKHSSSEEIATAKATESSNVSSKSSTSFNSGPTGTTRDSSAVSSTTPKSESSHTVKSEQRTSTSVLAPEVSEITEEIVKDIPLKTTESISEAVSTVTSSATSDTTYPISVENSKPTTIADPLPDTSITHIPATSTGSILHAEDTTPTKEHVSTTSVTTFKTSTSTDPTVKSSTTPRTSTSIKETEVTTEQSLLKPVSYRSNYRETTVHPGRFF